MISTAAAITDASLGNVLATFGYLVSRMTEVGRFLKRLCPWPPAKASRLSGGQTHKVSTFPPFYQNEVRFKETHLASSARSGCVDHGETTTASFEFC